MLLSVQQVSEITGFSKGHIRYLIRNKKLKAKIIGNSYIVDKKDIKKVERLRSPNGTRKVYCYKD